MDYIDLELEIQETLLFSAWLSGLRDVQAKIRIQARILRLAAGNPGQHRVLKAGVCEMKIDYGPGYRLYYTQRNGQLVVLLCGGDKRSQQADIAERLVKGL